MESLEEAVSGYIAGFTQYLLCIIIKWHIYELIYKKLLGELRIEYFELWCWESTLTVGPYKAAENLWLITGHKWSWEQASTTKEKKKQPTPKNSIE